MHSALRSAGVCAQLQPQEQSQSGVCLSHTSGASPTSQAALNTIASTKTALSFERHLLFFQILRVPFSLAEKLSSDAALFVLKCQLSLKVGGAGGSRVSPFRPEVQQTFKNNCFSDVMCYWLMPRLGELVNFVSFVQTCRCFKGRGFAHLLTWSLSKLVIDYGIYRKYNT